MDIDFASDLSAWTNALHESARRARDLTPVHEQIGDFLVPESKDNFETSGGPEKWADLRPATLAARARKYPFAGDKPLIVTRELFNSMTKVAAAAFVDVGSALKKARTLFFGRGPVPARSPFKWRSGVLEHVGELYLRYLVPGAS